MGLVGYSNRFLKLIIESPGSTHDVRLLRNTGLFKQILNGQGLPYKTVDLRDKYGKIPFVTIGDSAFARFSCLLKNHNCNTNAEREKYYNIKMNSPRIITQSCHVMLKTRWWILYKKGEPKVFSLKNSIILLHNFCIAKRDLCNSRWRLSDEELEVNDTVIKRRANKEESNKNARKIANWLWKKA